MLEKRVDSWKEVEDYINFLIGDSDPKSFLFRGQSNSKWNFASTLERRLKGGRCSVLDYFRIAYNVKPFIETATDRTWAFPTANEVVHLVKDYDAFSRVLTQGTDGFAYPYLVYLRHHGFPSPLVDWTASRWVAAYFAIANSDERQDSSIFIFREQTSNIKIRGSDAPGIYTLGPYVKSHVRHFRQQSRYTICVTFEDGEWWLAPHVTDQSHMPTYSRAKGQQDLFWKITFPSRERLQILAKLDEFNLNAFTLFDSEDSMMETLAVREIEMRPIR